MLKAIILDVDGVIVGKKQGVNFPLPNELVTQKLKEVQTSGIPVVLCTAKFHYAVQKIIEQARLRNPHITDGGALIIDPLGSSIIKKHTLDKQLVHSIVSTCLNDNLYTEVYKAEDYYIQKGQINTFTEQRLKVLQKEPKVVDSLVARLANLDVIKIIAFAKDEEDIKRVEHTLQPFMSQIHLVFTMNPVHLPFRNGIITTKGISKKQATKEVLDYLNISPADTLAVGDTLGDWNFMKVCGYAATVGNDSQELKDLTKTKGDGNYFFGSSVDNNGLLDILNYFGL